MKSPARRTKPAATEKEPYVVHPREAAKAFPGYDTDPEILLACILTSGTYDTSEICRTEINLANELAPATGIEAERYEAFRRVWSQPTEEEKAPRRGAHRVSTRMSCCGRSRVAPHN